MPILYFSFLTRRFRQDELSPKKKKRKKPLYLRMLEEAQLKAQKIEEQRVGDLHYYIL